MADYFRITFRFNSSRNIAALVIVCVVVIIFTASIWYVAARVRTLDQKIVMLGNAIQEAEEGRAQRRSAVMLLEHRAGDIARIERVQVSRTQPVSFIEFLEDIANRTDNKITLTIEENPTEIEYIGFRATVSGTAASVRNFLRAVEKTPHLLEIGEIIFERIEPQSVGQRANLTLGIRVFSSQMIP